MSGWQVKRRRRWESVGWHHACELQRLTPAAAGGAEDKPCIVVMQLAEITLMPGNRHAALSLAPSEW